jgi:hypothetical protein
VVVEVTALDSYEANIEYLAEAPRLRPINSGQRRHLPPKVPEGEHVLDENPSPEVNFDLPQMFADALEAAPDPDELVIQRQQEITALAGRDTSSQVNEPSAAINGELVFYTGNWYAAISTDGGATFRFVDPFHQFTDPPGLGFCCDQVVHYIPQIDTFVWLLQYTNRQNPGGPNVQRLAFATTASAALGRWRIHDISPASLGKPGLFLDFPDLAVGENMLYMTTNMFSGSSWAGSAVVRIPIAGIQSGTVTAQAVTSSLNSGVRVAQNCGTRAFWAAHLSTSRLRVFHWDENAAAPSSNDINNIPTWVDVRPYTSIVPDTRRWLNRADGRIVGATLARANNVDELWFAWGSNRGGVNQRKHPFIQIARINSSTFQLIDSINLHHNEVAFAYPALATNQRGEVAASYFIGGGGNAGKFPTHAISLLTGVRKDVTVAASLFGPFRAQGQDRNGFGDYVTVRKHSPNGNLFAATGYTLQLDPVTEPQNAVPHFVIFGRGADIP